MWRLANLGRALPIAALMFCSLFNSTCGTETNDTPPAVNSSEGDQ